MRSRSATLLSAVAAATLVLTSCSGEATTGGGGPVTLEFWAWPVGTQEIVDAFNEAHPDIRVEHTDAGGGTDSSAKLLTASRAGDAPDVSLVEYQMLPSLVVADVVADITEHTADIKDAFTEGTWAQTRFGDAVYGIPQDIGPMCITYRHDLFTQLGLSAPTTWADFEAAARTVKERNPEARIAAIPPDAFGFFAGVAAQAGSDWWSVDGDRWAVGIADDASLEVADFFERLVDQRLVSTDPLLTPEYNAALSKGTMLSWPSALWAPGVLHGVAPDTAGKWAMAPLPQWEPGETTVSFQGGSALVVTKNSEHPEEAAEFAKWYNASKEGVNLLVDKAKAYTAAVSGQRLMESASPPPLMPQQTDFYQVAAQIAQKTKPVTWGPNVNVAQTTLTDALTKAIQNNTPWRDAFIETQKVVVEDMRKNGMTVSES
ncbi:ABC transporter substrate-binding protein [Saccharothrix saharensis]|uniref:ABC transporter substrate-binding protein n=1 Tax=Saccharothrix saharensis TaxID=571190 RepID=UPI0036AC3788